MNEHIFGHGVVNLLNGVLHVDKDDMSLKTAEAYASTLAERDRRGVNNFPKGSDLRAAMLRRADAYRVVKIVVVEK